MNDFSPPVANAANFGSLAGAIEFVLGKYLQATDDMLPARVVSYNRQTNRAQVQPLISVVTTNTPPRIVQRAQVMSVPVLQLGGGGFLISFPLPAGSLGWIKANDRDISLFKKTLQSARPNTQRKHSFEDAIFIPDVMNNGVTISPDDADNAVIQSLNGVSRVSLSDTGIGIGGPPSPSAVLDVQSTERAFIFPRMTTVQKNAIPDPEPGMAVFDITNDNLSVFTAGGGWS